MTATAYRVWLAVTVPLIVACFTTAWLSADRAFGHDALAPAYIGTVRIDVPLPPVRHVHRTRRIGQVCGPDAQACTHGTTVFAAVHAGRFAVAHDLGHLFDREILARQPDTRTVLMRDLGLRPGAWTSDRTVTDRTTGQPIVQERTGTDCTPQDCPNEVFADAYASCRLHMLPIHYDQQGRRVFGWTTAYGWLPRTNRVELRVCQAIRDAAVSAGVSGGGRSLR